MNIRHLEALVAVADAGSLAAAARKLGLSSTTVAEQIAALDKYFGATLVERRGRHSVLSDAGHAVLADARNILRGIGEMHQSAQLGALKGVLRVGSITSALTSFVPDALTELARKHPGIELILEPATTKDLYEKLERNEIDCAITAQPPFSMPKAYSWCLIQNQSLVLLAPLNLPGETVEELLAVARLIRMDRSSWTGHLVTSYLRDFKLAPTELFEMSAQSTIILLVARGLGVALLPDTGIQETRQLKKIVVGDARHVRQLGLLGSRGSRKALIRALADSLVTHAGRET